MTFILRTEKKTPIGRYLLLSLFPFVVLRQTHLENEFAWAYQLQNIDIQAVADNATFEPPHTFATLQAYPNPFNAETPSVSPSPKKPVSG